LTNWQVKENRKKRRVPLWGLWNNSMARRQHSTNLKKITTQLNREVEKKDDRERKWKVEQAKLLTFLMRQKKKLGGSPKEEHYWGEGKDVTLPTRRTVEVLA